MSQVHPLPPVAAAAEIAPVLIPRLAGLLDTLPSAIALIDRSWHIVYANQEAVRLAQLPEDRLPSNTLWELFPGLAASSTGERYCRVMESGVDEQFEQHIERTGQWFAVDLRASPEGLALIYRDISLKRQIQDREAATSRRSLQVYEAAPDCIVLIDREYRFTFANQRAVDLLGVPELLGHNIFELFPGNREEPYYSAYTTAMEERRSMEFEAFHGAPLNLWFRVQAQPYEDGIIIFFSDVTQRRQAVEELRRKQIEAERQHAELETIYRTSPVGLALLDPVDFTFLNLNDREAEMLGRPKAELVGRKLEEIAPIPELLELFRSVAEGKTVRSRLLEGELATRPGERRAWSVNYSPLFDEHGKVRAISTASIEMTDQKRAEAALVQSEKLAAVGRLASSISHEINNPLEAITNLLYIIAADQTLSEGLKPYVHMAQSELTRVSQIVTQTLRFHRQAVAPTFVTAQELVNAVVQLYTGRLSNSNIVVEARYASQTRLRCFENDVRQVLNNLIANAIDAMRTGGRLIIRAHDAVDRMQPGATLTGTPAWQFASEGQAWTAAGRRGVRITIADTGCGMTAQTIARAFEPFFTTKDLNGTGLGLWISAGIVERHQGRLRVRSSVAPQNHYTVFSLFLPCEEIPAG